MSGPNSASEPRAARVGLTNMEIAEKRRRIAEIVYLVAKAKAEIAVHEATLPTTAKISVWLAGFSK